MNEMVLGRDTNRIPLYTVVPKAVPFGVGIALSDVCNFRCIYCNQSTDIGIRDARVLPWCDYVKIVEQLEDLVNKKGERYKIIRFIGNGEPLVNKNIARMVRYISEKMLADSYCVLPDFEGNNRNVVFI